MPEDRFAIGIVVAKCKLEGCWAEHIWRPVLALPAAPATAPWTQLVFDGGAEWFYVGSYDVSLHSTSTSHYRDNLMSGRPSLWVALHSDGQGKYEILSVTADPYEGEALTEWAGEIVDAVPMPAEIQARVAAFFEKFHQERTFVKRRRDDADPGGRTWDALRGPARREPMS